MKISLRLTNNLILNILYIYSSLSVKFFLFLHKIHSFVFGYY